MKSWILGLMSSLIVFHSPAQAARVVPPDSEVIHEIAPGTTDLLPGQLNFLIWNIEKAKGAQRWQSDFQNLSRDRHVVLIQEGVEEPFILDTLRSISYFGWLMARSFFMETDHKATGIITGGLQKAWSSVFLRSRDTEPIINTPKMALLTTYQMQDGSRLLVVNIHAINFTGFEPFQRQIDDIAGILRGWQGRIVFAGDFNTWSGARTSYLKKITAALGLTEIGFASDSRKLVLDHIFVRGCSPLSSAIHSNIDSSDHFPLTTELMCAN